MTIQPPGPPRSAQDILSSFPGGGAQPTEQRKPIGVPEGYAATLPGGEVRLEGMGWRPAGDRQVPPSFFEGDEYVPAQLSQEARARLQLQMYRLGILTRDFQVGVWDAPSRLAYRSVLEFANASGISDEQQALLQYGTILDTKTGRTRTGGPDAGKERELPPLVIRESNPDDLRRTFQLAARQALGRRADDGTIDRMIAAYQQAEASSQTSLYNETYGANGATAGGTVTDAPDPASFALGEFEEEDPLEVQAFRGADSVMNSFMRIIGGDIGG